MTTEQEITEFYRKNSPILPTYPSRRHYRLKLQNGQFLKIPKLINNPKLLQAFFLHFKPLAVYHTVSTWLAPNLIGAKNKTYIHHSKWLSNSFLFSDLVLDFDKEDASISNISYSIKTLQTLFPTKKMKLIQTGEGYHLHVLEWNREVLAKYPSPFDRETKDLSLRRKILSSLKKLNFKFDYNTLLDTRRLVRVENTLHENGNIIKQVPLTEFAESGVESIELAQYNETSRRIWETSSKAV